MRHILVFYLILLFVGCVGKKHQKPPTPEQLYKKYEKSVVLIRYEYYYEISLDNGIKVYFSDFLNDEIINIMHSEGEILDNPSVAYGTGFFISKDGKIATNNHVVNPKIDITRVLKSLKRFYEENKYSIEERRIDNEIMIEKVKKYVIENYNQLSYYEVQHYENKINEMNRFLMSLKELKNSYDFNVSRSNVSLKTSFLGIASNNTFVTNRNDFKQCVLINHSDNEEIDVAIIQLKEKQTPTFVKNIFNFKDNNPNEQATFDPNKPIKINTQLFMIGFNYGTQIGNTTDGLKAQLTQGFVSQESDKIRLLYSIPSLSGSSGSPVIDKWGNLVAINYAKVNNTQSFNYGILSKHLSKLLKQ